jgi:hypothetical protein
MEEITPEQFLENVKSWEPGKDFARLVDRQLRAARAPEALLGDLDRAFQDCSRSTFEYIRFIHELATTQEVGRENLLALVARLVGLVQKIQESAKAYRDVFRRYDLLTREGLTRDHFDTVYYDAIQNVELRVLLKKIIEEVEVVLQSFSLVSGDLSGIPCVGLYESSVRFHLFLQYFLTKPGFSNEELWSVLFDVYNQVGEMLEFSVEPTEEELKDLQEKIRKYRTN